MPKCAGHQGITGYFIYYKIKDKSFDKTDLVKCCSYQISNVKEGIEYEIYVVAVDNQGEEGMQSKFKSIKTIGKL